jgi:hypothetical protein
MGSGCFVDLSISWEVRGRLHARRCMRKERDWTGGWVDLDDGEETILDPTGPQALTSRSSSL